MTLFYFLAFFEGEIKFFMIFLHFNKFIFKAMQDIGNILKNLYFVHEEILVCLLWF